MNLLEHSRHDLPRSVYLKLKQQVDEARHQHDDEALAELLSGIPIIEALLDDYLIKHAIPSYINDAVQRFNFIAKKHDIKQKLDNVLNMSEKIFPRQQKNLKILITVNLTFKKRKILEPASITCNILN
ncbi:MAG: hypothetical protein ACQEWL_21145 [Pseudomonadota bacterium]